MKRFNGSRWDDERGEPAAPAGGDPEPRHGRCAEQRGSRARRDTAARRSGPCASFEEAYRRYGRWIWGRILGTLAGRRGRDGRRRQGCGSGSMQRIRDDESGARSDPAGALRPRRRRGVQPHRAPRSAAARTRRPTRRCPPASRTRSSSCAEAEHRAALKRSAEAIFARMSADEVELIKRAHAGEEALKDVAEDVGVSEAARCACGCTAPARVRGAVPSLARIAERTVKGLRRMLSRFRRAETRRRNRSGIPPHARAIPHCLHPPCTGIHRKRVPLGTEPRPDGGPARRPGPRRRHRPQPRLRRGRPRRRRHQLGPGLQGPRAADVRAEPPRRRRRAPLAGGDP